MRFPHLAPRSAAAHKLHSTPQRDRMNLISGKGETSSRLPAFSLFLPGTCPNNRDRRSRTKPTQLPLVHRCLRRASPTCLSSRLDSTTRPAEPLAIYAKILWLSRARFVSGYPIRHRVRSKDARGFVVGDDAEYAFACTMISLWEGARA